MAFFCGIGCAGRRHDGGRGPCRETQGSGRLQLSRQGSGWSTTIRTRRRHERSLGLGCRLQGHARVRTSCFCSGTDFPYEELHAQDPQDRADRRTLRERLGRPLQARSGPVRRCRATRSKTLLPLVQPQVDRSFLDGRHARASRRARGSKLRLRRSRQHATADPPRARRRHAGRTRRTGRRIHHRHPGCAPSGVPCYLRPPRAGDFLPARSTTGRWLTPCRRRFEAADGLSRATGDLSVRRWRAGDAPGASC